MGKFVLGAVFGVIVLMVVVVGYFLSGRAPVATDAPPMPLEKFLAKKALHAVLDRDMPKTVPIPVNEPNYLAGAQVYKDNCAVCHGLPGQPATAIAHGAWIRPPRGERTQTRQSPSSSRTRSTRIVEASGTARVAAIWSRRYWRRFSAAIASRS